MADLLDASVWLPLSAPDHEHHPRVRHYWDREASDDLAFCRVTALALLRHLTNPRILGDAALDGKSAWRALETWLTQPQVMLLAEPDGIDELLRDWAAKLNLQTGAWTDAYLAAFAIAAGCRLVTFDKGFRRFSGVQLLLLT